MDIIGPCPEHVLAIGASCTAITRLMSLAAMELYAS